MPTETYDSPGTYTFDASQVTEATVEVYGAGGGIDSLNQRGGGGGYVTGVVDLSGVDTVHITVGDHNGGGAANDGAATGGGASDIRIGGQTLSDRVLVGGGGGGAGYSAVTAGDGGYPEGEPGGGEAGYDGGNGGTQVAGGAGGSGTDANGGDGSFGAGGDTYTGGTYSSGSGGGGWYGGGGGGWDDGDGGGAGGGGSSYYDDTVVSSFEHTTGARGGGLDGSVTIDYVEAPESPTDLVASEAANGVDLSFSANDPDHDTKIYRSTSPGVTRSDTLVATLSPGDGSYSDTSALDGRRYHYRAWAYDSANDLYSEASNEDSILLQLPAPTGLIVDEERATEADLSWTTNTPDATGHRIDVREDDSGSWTPAATGIAGGAESGTATGLLNGQLYGARVVALGPDDEQPDLDGPANYQVSIADLRRIQ